MVLAVADLPVFVGVEEVVVVVKVVLPVARVVSRLHEMFFKVGCVLLKTDFSVVVEIGFPDVGPQVVSCALPVVLSIAEGLVFYRLWFN